MRYWKVCPICGLEIDSFERKDFESFTGREYAEHVKLVHPEKVMLGGFGVPYAQEFSEEDEG